MLRQDTVQQAAPHEPCDDMRGEPICERTSSQHDLDRRFINRALELAARGTGLVSPSPLVGCVIANDAGEVVGEGYYVWDKVDHAEALALREAGARARGATAYVSLEPHAHQGRTPPCTEALIRAGVRRVVVAIEDPNPLVAGNGFKMLRDAGVEVTTGVSAREATLQNEKYICAMRLRRPFVHLKMAVSLDGRINFGERHAGETTEHANANNPRWLTGTKARQRVHELRHGYDAILVGANTVRKDDPLLTDRSNKPRRRPLVRIVLDEKLSFSDESQLVCSVGADNPLLVISDERTADRAQMSRLVARGVEIELMPEGTRDLSKVLERLYALGLHSVFVEGGASVASSFLAAELVDKVTFIVAPLFVGSNCATPAVHADFPVPLRLRDVTHRKHNDDVEITGYPER